MTATRTRAWPLLLSRMALRSATAMVALLVVFLVIRRLSGQFEALPGAGLILVAVLAAIVAIGWRHTWRILEGEHSPAQMMGRFLPPVVLLLLAVAFSIPGTHPLGLLLFWAVLVGEEVWHMARVPRTLVTEGSSATVSAPVATIVDEEEVENEVDLLPPGATQQMTRSVEAGIETLECLLRVSFVAGQQNETLHVAFCPPLLNAPTGSCEALAGAPCEVKVAALETYGARIEVKRSGTTSLEDEAIVALHATSRGD